MKFKVTYTFPTTTDQDQAVNIEADTWQLCYQEAIDNLPTDGVLKMIDRLKSDIMSLTDKIHKHLLQFNVYRNLSSTDQADVCNYIEGKING